MRHHLVHRWMSSAPAVAWKDVHYTPQRHPMQTLDLVLPAPVSLPHGPRPHPRKRPPRGKFPSTTCIFIHGGSWQRGDKAGAFNDGIDGAFVRALGGIGVSVNYRLSPEVRHPDHARDVAAAVRFVHRQVEKYGGDPDELILVGHSAGAHLAMTVLADPQYLEAHGVRPRAVVGISGVYNVVRLANTSVYGPLVVNPAFGQRMDQWREGSISSLLVQHGHRSPLYRTPTLLLTADDDFHFGDDAQELERWLQEGGNDRVERAIIPGRNHFTILRELTADPEDATMARIRSFLGGLAVPC